MELLNRKYFKAVSLLTVFTIVFYMVSALFLVRSSAAALTTLSDTMTRQQVSVDSDHDISFTTPTGMGNGDTFTLDFDDGSATVFEGGDVTGLGVEDYDLYVNAGEVTVAAASGAGQWGVAEAGSVVTFTAPTDGTVGAGQVVRVIIGLAADSDGTGDTQLTNPTSVLTGAREIAIVVYSDVSTTIADTGNVEVPILDDDTVNVTGYIDSVLTFDIDTSELDEHCDQLTGTYAETGTVGTCDSHGGATDDSGYVVDLGEMTTGAVNESGDTGTLHADGLTGNINYVWFDAETNADGGLAVTMVSLVGVWDNDDTPDGNFSALEGPGTNEIPSLAARSTILSGDTDGEYGFAESNESAPASDAGALAPLAAYADSGGSTWGPIPSSAGTLATIFNSGGNPVDSGRIQFEVAAHPDTEDGTGTYTDELTFVATSTF